MIEKDGDLLEQGRLDQLDARHAELSPARSPSPSMLKRLVGLEMPREVGPKAPDGPQIVMTALAPYVFMCPNDHIVDGNRGIQFPLAIIGPVGSSKSHFLPAIVRELNDLMRFREIGVRLREALWTSEKVEFASAEIYRRNHVLQRTRADEGVFGPYGYRLDVRSYPESLSLLLFDVAGESLGTVLRIADEARFVFLSEGVIVLIDPDGFLPSRFDVDDVGAFDRLNVAIDVRKSIHAVVMALAEAWGTRTEQITTPFCFVIAKADAVRWHEFEWANETARVIASIKAGEAPTDVLRAASNRARDAFCQLGGEDVVREIEDLLGEDVVRFAAASATSAMAHIPEDGPATWDTEQPEPCGVALSVLQVLDVAGVMVDRSDNIREP